MGHVGMAGVPETAGGQRPEKRRRNGRRSTAGEGCLAWALLEEGSHPRCAVLSGEERRELLTLDLQPRVEVGLQAVVNGLLGGAECKQRTGGELARPCEGGGIHLFGLDHLV